MLVILITCTLPFIKKVPSKVNESQYKPSGITAHFIKPENSCQNVSEAGSAMTIDNDISS